MSVNRQLQYTASAIEHVTRQYCQSNFISHLFARRITGWELHNLHCCSLSGCVSWLVLW